MNVTSVFPNFLCQSTLTKYGMIDEQLGTYRLLFDVVNRILKLHNDAVYYSLAIRAVAQQIDQLYWDSSTPESAESNRGLDDDSELHQTDDLTHDEYVNSLAPLHRRSLVSIDVGNANS